MAWFSPSTWYASATSAAANAWDAGKSLFAGQTPVIGPENSVSQSIGLFEPNANDDVIDYDPTEPYTDRLGNMGCPPGYYTDYAPGGKVCRRYGYDQNGRLSVGAQEPTMSLGETLNTWAGKVADAIAAPAKALKSGAESGSSWFGKVFGGGLLKGSYAIIGILVAVALVLFIGNRFLERRGL